MGMDLGEIGREAAVPNRPFEARFFPSLLIPQARDFLSPLSSSTSPSRAANKSSRHGDQSGEVMAGEDGSGDPPLDPLFSYPQIPSVLPPQSSLEAMGRGSLMAPRVGLSRPPPAAPLVSSIQAGTAAGRAGPAHGRPGQAADGQPAGAQAARPQATADHRPPASSSRKQPLAAKKKDEQVLLLAIKLQNELLDA
ncbi:hypothetical protein E2562_014436 [Oryza meyeriana var. granulata]|uniref:Uncharacterized protein n=1 Tax=Oryza meyeriana var. granulata TaxID=110450 RepID=A0A6G1CR97_9ORYZ|nr:hypothetical protein E2562_014436 [Oryza meyeriana var. granulata]